MAQHETENDPYARYHAPLGVGKYLAVFAALCLLTATSFVIGNVHWSTPSVGRMGMLAVSCAKALLVILFFMHLKWEANWKYVLTVPAIMLSLFLLLMLVPDIGGRTKKYNRTRWLHATPPRAERATDSHVIQENGADRSGDLLLQ